MNSINLFSKFIFLLFILVAFAVNGQVSSLENAYITLLSHPPVIGKDTIRKACFDLLDEVFKSQDASTNDNVKEFYNGMLENVKYDIKKPCTAAAVVYSMYNHGFIIKMPGLVIGFDLTRGVRGWNYISQEILEEIDILFVTHKHNDHYDPTIVGRVMSAGGLVIIPAEMDHKGAIKMATEDSINLSGFVIKAYDGVHNVPVRVYEVISPTGLKIVHTGDNQDPMTMPYIDDINILLLNSWLHEGDYNNAAGMYTTLVNLEPELMIPGHFNELNHSPEQRFPYDSAFVVIDKDPPADVVVMAWCEKYEYQSHSCLPIHATQTPPVIDGLWDSTWSFVPEITLSRNVLEIPNDWDDLYGTFRTLWDEENLYLFIKVRDDTLRTDNPDIWNNDAIELFFDGDNSKNNLIAGYDENDTRLCFEYSGGTSNASNTEYFWQTTETGYNLELRIPASDLKFNPLTEQVIGFDVQVNDNDKGSQNSILRWWSDDININMDPSLFGTALLSGQVQSPIKEIDYTPGPIVIDGEYDQAWIGKEWHVANQVILGDAQITNPKDNSILWNALWDTEYLYFILDIADDTLFNDSGEDYFQDDCIEFWLDGDNSKDADINQQSDFGLQFRYHPVSVIGDVKVAIGLTEYAADISQAAKLTEDGWRLEVAIPLLMMGIQAYDSSLFGFDIDYNDDDDGGDRESKLKTFAQFDDSWQHPSEWAVGMLNGSGLIEEFNDTISKAEILESSSFILYPNPFNSSIGISYYSDLDTDILVKLVTLSGKLIYAELFNISGTHTELILRLPAELQEGLYILELITDKTIYTRLLQKQY